MVPGRFLALTSVNQMEWMTHAEAQYGSPKVGEQARALTRFHWPTRAGQARAPTNPGRTFLPAPCRQLRSLPLPGPWRGLRSDTRC